jgi:CRISPR/Cas system-associated exonuclease Cas4 (RecB family)
MCLNGFSTADIKAKVGMLVKSDKLKISASAIKTYTQCPRKYYYTYIERLPKKKWPHIDLGNFVHAVLEAFHNLLRDNPRGEEEWGNVLKDICRNTLKKHPLTKEQRKQATAMLDTYLSKLRSDGLPKVICNEKSFTIELAGDIVLRGFIDRVDQIDGGVEIVDYKGLAIDTAIPTPSGWATMGSLSVGDMVLGSDGSPTQVMAKSQVHNRPCYRLEFSDNYSIVCDNVHLWKVIFRDTDNGNEVSDIIDAEALCHIYENNKHILIDISNHRGIDLPESELPFSPRMLGEYIGRTCDDLHASNLTNIKLSEMLIESDGAIPLKYLRGSRSQRIELLTGLMDHGGSWDKATKRVSFTTSNPALLDSVSELLHTFGITLYGDDEINTISFTPTTFNPFNISSYTHMVDGFLKTRDWHVPTVDRRTLTNITKIDSVPTQCISVASADSLYLCGDSFILTHNTGKSKYLDEFQLLVYALAIWHEDPNMERIKGSYIVLGEGSKPIHYTISKTDADRCVGEIIKVANQIRSDLSWETRPTRLCSYCDFQAACPATKQADFSSWGNAITEIE